MIDCEINIYSHVQIFFTHTRDSKAIQLHLRQCYKICGKCFPPRGIIVYIEYYQSVCPFVGIGSFTPSTASECVFPLGLKGGRVIWFLGGIRKLYSQSNIRDKNPVFRQFFLT
jgi:hypothetical protein